ncbi:hypothetical protein FG379_002922 [Cryptosporidium bovis]|uniref:uncharacterized protein n=1 Tax=Cryptosporidium bovis TaxID=310047 RepID=UPI00351A50DF|nr:hypothetical protein FG379_002922 [Cryptosporidium bovis]
MKILYLFLFSLLGAVLSQKNLKHTYSFISPCTAKLDYILSVGESFSRSDIILYGECSDKTTFTLLALSSGVVTGVALPDEDKNSDILVGSGDPIYTLSADLGFSFLYRTHSKKTSSGFIGINVLKYEPSHVDGRLVITPLLKHTSADCIYPTVAPSRDQTFCEFHENLLWLGTNVELSANEKFNLFVDFEKKHASRGRSAVSKTCSNSFHSSPEMSERQLAFIFSCIFFPHDSMEAAAPMTMSVRSEKTPTPQPTATAAVSERVESSSEDDDDDDGSCGSCGSCSSCKNKKDKSPKVESVSEDNEDGSCGSCKKNKKDKSSKIESSSEDDDEDGSCGSCKNKGKLPDVEFVSADDEDGSCGSCKKNKKDKSSKIESSSEDDDEDGSCGSLVKMMIKMAHVQVPLV